MKRPHPLLVLLLLLAMLPAVVGGSLTRLCACEGLMYVAGCSCISNRQAAESTVTCTCGCTQTPSRLSGISSVNHTPDSTPAPPGQEPSSPHDCDYMAYQMSLSTMQAQLPPCPMALLHEACMPLPVWQHRQSPLPDTRVTITRILPNERPRPLLI